MRVTFLILLLANLLYFAWSTWLAAPPPPAADSIAKLPKLVLTSELPRSTAGALESPSK